MLLSAASSTLFLPLVLQFEFCHDFNRIFLVRFNKGLFSSWLCRESTTVEYSISYREVDSNIASINHK